MFGGEVGRVCNKLLSAASRWVWGNGPFHRDTPHLSYTPIPQIFMEHLMCQRAAELDKVGRKSCPPGAWLLRT